MPADTLTVEPYDVDALAVYYRNPRRGDVAAIAASLQARGQYKPIVVNLGTLTGRPLEVLAGNHTLLAARSIRWLTVQAVTVDVDDAEAAAIVAADNRLSDLGGYDDADLAFVLAQAGDLTGTGYDEQDLTTLLRALADPQSLTDPDDAPELPAKPVSVQGDVWHLGEHILVVGKSGNVEALREVAPARGFDMVWTDPPYGVDIVGGNHELTSAQRRAKGGKTIQNDGTDLVAALGVTRAFLDAAVQTCIPGAPVYMCMSPGPDQAKFVQTGYDAGLVVRQMLVWVKSSFVLSHIDYHPRFEPILYGFTPGGKGRLGRGGDRWYGDNKQDTVFEVPRPARSALHPTMKPVELVELMLANSCPPGGWVLDGFGGSGTTLIAAHRLGRRACLVELDEGYADVIVRRFQEHTGIMPIRRGEQLDMTGGAQ